MTYPVPVLLAAKDAAQPKKEVCLHSSRARKAHKAERAAAHADKGGTAERLLGCRLSCMRPGPHVEATSLRTAPAQQAPHAMRSTGRRRSSRQPTLLLVQLWIAALRARGASASAHALPTQQAPLTSSPPSAPNNLTPCKKARLQKRTPRWKTSPKEKHGGHDRDRTRLMGGQRSTECLLLGPSGKQAVRLRLRKRAMRA